MDNIVNWELLSHPYNWIIVVLILAIVLFSLTILAEPLQTVGNLVQIF